MLRAVSLLTVLVLSACGSKPPVAANGAGNGKTGATGSSHVANPNAGQGATPTGAGTGSAGSAGLASAPDVGCLAPTCAYHAGTATYLACLAGGAGACFHYGAPCTPADACMYDAADRTYKTCSTAVEGQCKQWGAACAPASKCMFSPTDGLHHTCEAVTGGTCSRYGALCAP